MTELVLKFCFISSTSKHVCTRAKPVREPPAMSVYLKGDQIAKATVTAQLPSLLTPTNKAV